VVGATLEYTGHTLILFDDHSYRWFSVKRFAWDDTGDDTAVLAALIAHPRYRDHYAARDSHERDAGDIHGPYRLSAISPAEFVPVGPDGAAALVEEFCVLFAGPPRPEVREEIAASVLSWLGRSSWYRLRDLPDALHEWGWVLMEFRELVAISREASEVLSVVMAID
jgi:hypothetical protein